MVCHWFQLPIVYVYNLCEHLRITPHVIVSI